MNEPNKDTPEKRVLEFQMQGLLKIPYPCIENKSEVKTVTKVVIVINILLLTMAIVLGVIQHYKTN